MNNWIFSFPYLQLRAFCFSNIFWWVTAFILTGSGIRDCKNSHLMSFCSPHLVCFSTSHIHFTRNFVPLSIYVDCHRSPRFFFSSDRPPLCLSPLWAHILRVMFYNAFFTFINPFPLVLCGRVGNTTRHYHLFLDDPHVKHIRLLGPLAPNQL
jgi:hypothetical protein